MMVENSTLVFFVNGKKIIEEDVDPECTLLYYLRTKLRLCGTKLGCAEGGCGACTVMVSKYLRNEDKIVHIPVNACLAPVCSMHGLAVTTVEGIGSTQNKLHSAQERIAKAHGSQCGFCTPGFVMSMYTLLRQKPKPSLKDLQTTFQGNLCRCTGYRPILEGYKTFVDFEESIGIKAENNINECTMGALCCKRTNGTVERTKHVLFQKSDFKPYDPSQEPIFPPELKISNVFDEQSLFFKGPRVCWYRPTSLQSLLHLKDAHPDSKIIVGNTEVGVEVKFKNQLYDVLINPTRVPEMTKIEVCEDGLKVGASVTLKDLDDYLRNMLKSLPNTKSRIFKAIVDTLHRFAGKQIRSVASIGGNIMTGSPTSDLTPIFMAAKIEMEIINTNGSIRKVYLDENFYTAYRRNIINKNEVLLRLLIPYTEESQFFYAYKQSRRREDDRAIVNFAINVHISPKTCTIDDIRMAFGGMAATTAYPKITCNKLLGRKWDQETLDLAMELLLEDLPLTPSSPGGMMLYRQSLSLSLFFKSFLRLLSEIQKSESERNISATDEFTYKFPKSSQYFRESSKTFEHDTVGTPFMIPSGFQNATGEAVYCDDMPHFNNQLYIGFVLSTKSHARIKAIDPSLALNVDGVRAFYSAKDIPEDRNKFNFDEEVFVSETCTSQGQILGVVVAEDAAIAKRAAKLVNVKYEELQPVIITIEDAIKYNSYLPNSDKRKEKGDVDAIFEKCKNFVECEARTGAQEHFYLEPSAVSVIPKMEDNEIIIICTTQNPTGIAVGVSSFLGVPQNRVIVKVKRIGGGFGGKEQRPLALALPVAFAASKLNQPVRCSLERDEDILYKGTRNPFLMKYKVAFDDNGVILAIDLNVYVNAGRSNDLSVWVLEKAMLQFFTTYKCDNIRFNGICCMTNLQTCTALRGFGSPQIVFVTEDLIREVADALNKDVIEIMKKNFFKVGDCTYYNQIIEDSTLEKCFNECLIKSCFYKRRKDIEKFNRENRWKKRGITVVPLLYAVGSWIAFMKAGAALLHVYVDGSVLLTHGGMEMGQGLHAKMIQIASRALEVPSSQIFISETSTDKVPNTMPTADSVSSDLNGAAVLDACQKIKNRLEPYKKKNPKGTWKDWVKSAFLDRVSLSATGYYATPDIGYDIETNVGRAVDYYVNGACCTEVVIDCLTGDHQILRTDIVMDVGKSLNPAIDIGQIEGAFVQGAGFYTIEEMVYLPDGQVFTTGPGTYKVPGFNDIPLEFNVTLLEEVGNPRAVYSSKGVGEPPLCFSVSVFFAIKEAIKAARKEVGASPRFTLFAPATCERIRIACTDHITSKILEPPVNGYEVPWNVIP